MRALVVSMLVTLVMASPGGGVAGAENGGDPPESTAVEVSTAPSTVPSEGQPDGSGASGEQTGPQTDTSLDGTPPETTAAGGDDGGQADETQPTEQDAVSSTTAADPTGDAGADVTAEPAAEPDVTVVPAADTDLAVQATAPSTVGPGGTWVVTIEASNLGGGDTTAQVILILGGTTFVDATIPCDGGDTFRTCDLTLAAGATQTFTVSAAVPVGTPVGTEISVDVALNNLDGSDPNADNNVIQVLGTVASADLAVGKSDDPSVVIAGNALLYTVTVSNNGPSNASNVVVSDTLPAIVSFDAASAAPNCTEVAGTVTCALGDIAAGGSAQVEIPVIVNSDAPTGPVTNTASASSDTADPTPGNDTGSTTTQVARVADLSVLKVDAPDPVVAGEELTYTLTYGNAGPSDASGVTLTDTLPVDVNFVSATPDQGTCAEAAGVVTCTLGAVAAGGGGTVTIVVEVDPTVDDGTTLTNTVAIDGAETDPNALNDSAAATTQVQASADLGVDKSDSADPVTAGAQLTYTITYTNAGPSDGTDVVIIDTLPAEVSFVSATPDQGSCGEAAGVVTCPLGDIAAGGGGTVTIVVDVAPSVVSGTTLTNTVEIDSDDADADPSDNTATETTLVATEANLSVLKVDAPDPVVAGTQLTYTLTYANAGPSDATGVVVTDTLPAGTTFVSATPDQGSCAEASGVVTCTLGAVAAGGGGSITVVATVEASVPDGTTLANTAVIDSGDVDPDQDDNTATETTQVTAEADLGVGKADSPDPVASGTQLTYALTYANAGPSDATGVVVTDTLPAGTTFVSATPDQGSCAEAGGVVTCTLGAVAAGGGGSITVVAAVEASVPDGTTLTNTVAIDGNEPDPDPSDDTDTETTAVTTAADLSVVKTDAPDPVTAGTQLIYTLGFANAGPSDATGVVITDTLPAEVVFASATGGCSHAAGVVTCTIGALAAGASGSVQIAVDVPASVPDATTLTNTAVVAGEQTDPGPGDNTDVETTVVGRLADLSVLKDDAPDPVVAGTPLTYTITYANAGPSDATDVVVTDTLPAGTSFVSATPDQGSCLESAGVVTCILGDVAAGAGGTISLLVDVGPGAAGTTLANTAEIDSDDPDPDFANNQDTETTEVTAEADLGVAKVDSPDPVVAGGQLTYTITFTNAGPSDASGVVVTDTLPVGTTFVSASAGCSHAAGVVTCAIGLVPGGGSGAATVVVDVAPSVADGTTLTNTATIAGNEADANAQNDTATATTTVTRSADLAITKADEPDPVSPGAQLTYTLGIANTGPSDASGVVVTDTLPAGATFVAGSSDPRCVEAPPGTLTCTIGDMSAAATDSLTVVVTVDPTLPAGTQLVNTATVSGTETDPDPTDNSTSAVTEVAETADVAVTKSLGTTPIVAGTDVTWTVQVTNGGPSAATDVVVTDALPGATTFVSATPTAGSCAHAGGVLTCALGTLAVGDTVDIVVVTAVVPSAPVGSTLVNLATVTSTVADPDPSDNEATASGPITATADLAVTKSVSPSQWTAGGPITWTVVVTNTGPSAVAGAALTDALPATVVGATWSCQVTAGTGSCSPTSGSGNVATMLSLAPGSVATVVIRGTVASGATGTLTNSAAVVSAADPDPTDNSASASAQQAPPTGGGTGGGGGGIVVTGADPEPMVLGGLALVVAGLAAMVLASARRPRRHRSR